MKTNFININTFFILVIAFLLSCSNKNGYCKTEKISFNDSLEIKIYFNQSNEAINTIIIENKNSGINNVYGFHNDGITPSLIGKEKNGKRTGVYYTYYSSGGLNNKINYSNGKFQGNYKSYSEDGELLYDAYYENGVEKEVKVNKIDDEILIEEIE
jgi:antitoxin component YwqK of YwqJK toxin-antitoxin module